MAKTHPYHILPLSPWPLFTSIATFSIGVCAVMFFHHKPYATFALIFSLVSLLACMYGWWRNVIAESQDNVSHNNIVQHGLRLGMGLFIFSEAMFFSAFFASFFHFSLFTPDILDGVWSAGKGQWPPKNLELVDPWNLPLMNTLILLLSGTSVTWAHHSIMLNNKKDAASALLYTVILGVSFSIFQIIEYSHIVFKISDGVYPSNFYLTTGFHGVHVIIGTIFLAICYFRTLKGHFDQPNSHLGFEFAAWYWHFVDVVWLFLFVFIYL